MDDPRSNGAAKPPVIPAADSRRAGNRKSRTAATRPRAQRRTVRGDIAPRLTSTGIAAHAVGEAVGAAQESQDRKSRV